jgi:hypothetical protein
MLTQAKKYRRDQTTLRHSTFHDEFVTLWKDASNVCPRKYVDV